MRWLVVMAALVPAAALAQPQRLVVQRGTHGTVNDCYIWEDSPTYNGNSNTLYCGQVGTGNKWALLWFDVSELPATATILEARLVLEVTGGGDQDITVFHASTAWAETEPTWATFNMSYEPGAVGMFHSLTGRVSVDVTPAVTAWAQGSHPNHGLMLRQAPLTSPSTFDSSDAPTVSHRPSLEVLYELPAPLVDAAAPLPDLAATCGRAVVWPVKANAPGATTFSVDGPAGASVDADGQLTWTPMRSEVGSHALTVHVGDARGRTAALNVNVMVTCSPQLDVGCSAAPGELLGGLSLLALSRRRRRQPATAARSASTRSSSCA